MMTLQLYVPYSPIMFSILDVYSIPHCTEIVLRHCYFVTLLFRASVADDVVPRVGLGSCGTSHLCILIRNTKIQSDFVEI